MGFHMFSDVNAYKAPPPAEDPLAKLSIEELTARAVGLQSEADGLQRAANEARSALFRRRRQMIAEGADVPDSSEISGLPGWSDQFRSESIAFDNYQIDVAAGRIAR